MISLTLFLHHKETFGDKYSANAKVDPDGDVVLEFTHQHADCFRSESASVYLNVAQARDLRDRLSELLAGRAVPPTEAKFQEVAAPEVLAEPQRVAEPM